MASSNRSGRERRGPGLHICDPAHERRSLGRNRRTTGVDPAQAARAIVAQTGVSGEEVEARIEDPEEFRILSTLDAESECSSTDGTSSEPIEWDALALVLAVNQKELRARDWSVRDATIVLPDTGFDREVERRYTPFTNRRRSVSTRIALGSEPYGKDVNRLHGTYVAMVALGGLSFLPLVDTFGLDLELGPLNVFKEDPRFCEQDGVRVSCPRYSIRSEALLNVIRAARDIGAIVNLSVGRASPIASIESELGRDDRVLFVSAAGNDGVDLSLDGARREYPAQYGGDAPNLVTVAALDGERLAGFSNFGANHVDIAAPGCNQRVLEYRADGDVLTERFVAGTSFAAPWVSFTAALLKSYWRDATPSDLKRRLLTGAGDHRPAGRNRRAAAPTS